MSPANTFNSLEELGGYIEKCTNCNLCSSRTNTVPGEGNPKAQIMFIGEGPGESEDLHGRPFIGRAGELLSNALESADLLRPDIFITNIVKCRPPGNRNPSKEEMDACSLFLINQIGYIKPELIVVLGKVAAEYILKRPVKITKEHGKLDFNLGTPVMTVLHPAYILRNQKPEIKQAFFQAIKDARRIAYGIPNDSVHERGFR